MHRSAHVSSSVRPARGHRGIRLVLFIGGSLIIIAISSVIIRLFATQQSYWDVSRDQNIVIVPSKIDASKGIILLLSYRAEKGKTQLIAIPATTVVNVAGGYGQYPLQSIFPLLFIDKKSPQFVQATYSYAIGLPIDQVWPVENPAIFSIQTPGEIGWQVLRGSIRPAAFSLKDRVALYKALQSQQNRRQDLKSWEERTRQFPAYSQDFKSCRVAITNTTSAVGIGGIVSRVIEQSGGNVLRLQDDATHQPSSQIIINQQGEPCLGFVEHIQRLFPTDVEIRLDPQLFQRQRTELELRLGDDMAPFLAKD